MANFRYMVNFAEETLNSYWTGLLIQGGTYNPPKVKEYGGTRVATAVGTYTTQQCSIGQELETLLGSPRYYVTSGYLVMRMKYAHVQGTSVWSAICTADPNLLSAYYFYLNVDPGTGRYQIRAQKNVYSPWFVDVDTGITADGNPHIFNFRLGATKVYYRIDNSAWVEVAIPANYQLAQFSPVHCFVNGWAYIYWYELIFTSGDIYTADDDKYTVDGVGVANADVKLWDTTDTPPDYELTTGADGAIDYSTVDPGTYHIAIKDIFGYSCYGTYTKAGEPPE